MARVGVSARRLTSPPLPSALPDTLLYGPGFARACAAAGGGGDGVGEAGQQHVREAAV